MKGDEHERTLLCDVVKKPHENKQRGNMIAAMVPRSYPQRTTDR